MSWTEKKDIQQAIITTVGLWLDINLTHSFELVDFNLRYIDCNKNNFNIASLYFHLQSMAQFRQLFYYP